MHLTQNRGRTQTASKEVSKDDRLKTATIAMEGHEEFQNTDKLVREVPEILSAKMK